MELAGEKHTRKVALIYDDLASLQVLPEDPLDVGSEWEDLRTILGQEQALRDNGYNVCRIPFDKHLISRLQQEKPDVAFTISEGRWGKDRESIVPALCRQMGIACTSSDAVGMGVTLDKSLTKAAALALHIPTAKWAVIRKLDDLRHWTTYPCFVKPNYEGSSMGIRPESRVHHQEELKTYAAWVLSNIGPALVEAYLPGRELTVALLGNGEPDAFPVAEIRTGEKIYDKSMKSKDSMDEEVLCPADIVEKDAANLIAWSKRLFVELGLAGLARMDFKCDANGQPTFVEANPLPGLSKYYSVYTIQAAAAGLDYTALIGRLVELAFLRHEKEFKWR